MNKTIKFSPVQLGFLSFFLSQSFIFFNASSKILKYSMQDTWISLIIGFVISLLILILYLKFLNKYNNMNIFEINISKFGKVIGNLISIIECLFVLASISYILAKLCNFLTFNFIRQMPIFILALVFLLLVIYTVYKGIETICRTSQILAFISLIILIICISLLINYMDFSNFKPIFETGFTSILKGSFVYIINSIVHLFLIGIIPKNSITHENYYNKSIIIGHTVSFIVTFIVLNSSILVLSSNVATIFNYPEYVMINQISIFHFIERLENIFSIMFIFNVFVFCCMGIYFIDKYVSVKIKNKKTNKVILTLLVVMLILTLFIQ